MKAKDLKIGNLVRNNMNGEILIPCDILCDGINTENFEGLNYGFIEPIPLTEEWLVKFGFERHDEFLEIEINDDISIIWVGYLSIMIQGTIGFMNESELIYVHQLQNLYFALTNEELTIKSE